MSLTFDKEKIIRCFKRAHTSYDDNGIIQKKVGDELVGLLSKYPEIQFKRVLEIGCCTGVMTETLCRQHPIETLFVNDLVSEFEQTVDSRISSPIRPQLEFLFGDIEKLALPEDLDLVISSSTFQWLENLGLLFNRIADSLNSNGYLVFSLFGPGTLKEFRQLTGIGLHYHQPDDLIEQLKNRFKVKKVKKREETLYFTTPHLVLKHFQATGVGGVSEYRWASKSLKKFEKEYEEQFGIAAGVPVSYVSSLVVAEKR